MKTKKILSILLASVAACSFVACGGTSDDPTAGFDHQWSDADKEAAFNADLSTGRTSSLMEEKPLAIDGKQLITDGKSNYKIAIPETPTTAEGFAADELKHFLKEATGCELEVVSENKIADAPYISVGNTTLLENAELSQKTDDMGEYGCAILTKENDIYVVGADSTGVLNGVYQFLHYAVDYEAYSPEEIYLSKNDDVPLFDFDYVHTPAAMIATSTYSMRNIKNAARMKMWDGSWGGKNIDGNLWAGGYFAHATLHLLDPQVEPGKSHGGDVNTEDGWYSNGQLCLTKESAIEAMGEKVATVFKSSTSKIICLGGMDNGKSCGCNQCKEDAQKYGGVGGVYARWLNRVAEKVESILGEDEDFVIYGMAYNAYLKAPVTTYENGDMQAADESVYLNEHTGMLMVAMGTCYYHTMEEEHSDCPLAPQFAKHFSEWAFVSENIMGYTYGTNFHNYMIPFNDFNSIGENIKYITDVGYNYIYDQTTGKNELNGFIELKTYMKSKFGWDTQTIEQTDVIIDDFFVNYYKVAAPTMKKFYEKLRRHYAVIQEMKGDYCVGIYDSSKYTTKAVWPLSVVTEFEGYIEEAYEDIDNAIMSKTTKEVLRRRVMGEGLLPRYIKLMWYQSLYSDKEYEREYAQFIEDCKYCGTTSFQEGQTIA